MPSYYFHFRDSGGICLDEEGVELRDLWAAQQEAARRIGAMAREAYRQADRACCVHLLIAMEFLSVRYWDPRYAALQSKDRSSRVRFLWEPIFGSAVAIFMA